MGSSFIEVKMAQKLSSDLLKQFRDRWHAVAAVERQEQQSASIALRWQQMNGLWHLALGLDITASDREEEGVRQRWAKLKGIQNCG